LTKRKAEYRSATAQEEMRNLIHNANLLDERGGDYKITSAFETATGTTYVEIRASWSRKLLFMVVAVAIAIILVLLYLAFR
jgi:hypothetical protein